MKYILALDQGTTSSRAILYDETGRKRGQAARPVTQIYPRPGWVEHDAEEIFETQLAALRLAVEQSGAAPCEIAAAGVANQRETVVLWDRHTGRPAGNAVVWQCRRTADMCRELEAGGHARLIRQKTGLIIDAYFSATKLRWLLDGIPGARAAAARGDLLAGTVDTWLIWKLTGGRVHVTDVTNASRTMLFNIRTLSWDDELLELFDIPKAILPEVRSCSEVYGLTDPLVCGLEIPLAAAAGDQHAALFGQGCHTPGDTKNTYGTGCFLLQNTGGAPVESGNGLLTTVAWSLNGAAVYALEGSVFMGGALIQWLRDELGLIGGAPECDRLAAEVADSNGAYIVPAFVGLGAPHWDMGARGVIAGLTRGINKRHICRAALDAIAFQVNDVLDAMTRDSGIPIPVLRVDGGASASEPLLRFQADLCGVPVERPADAETTAMGAAMLAGLAVGVWPDIGSLKGLNPPGARFAPEWSAGDAPVPERVKTRLREWRKAVERSKNWLG
ncbi:MAG: glycerol kinase GlpK [Oscillospiraceae bacterium]|nr:glycerol kinase GlpK [Oscillospiraceae bacterium]